MRQFVDKIHIIYSSPLRYKVRQAPSKIDFFLCLDLAMYKIRRCGSWIWLFFLCSRLSYSRALLLVFSLRLRINVHLIIIFLIMAAHSSHRMVSVVDVFEICIQIHPFLRITSRSAINIR